MSFGLVVLVSGTGTLLQTLIDAARPDGRAPELEIRAVVADRDGIVALARADRAGIATVVLPYRKGSDRNAWDAELTAAVAGFAPELVISAGFMKLVGPAFLSEFGGRMINTHPALLPSFPGMHGPRDALAHGVKITGATVFAVDEGVDTGTILAQAPVAVEDDDSVETLHERIKMVERALLLDTVRRIARRHSSAAGTPEPGGAPEFSDASRSERHHPR